MTSSRTSAERAHRLIVDIIDDRRVRAGDRLPTESELISRLGLSRGTIREALARLRAEGRIVSRRGSGSYLARRSPVGVVRLSPIETVEDLLQWQEFRVALECEVVALAAERRGDLDLGAMRRAQKTLIARLAEGAYAEAEDAAFHRALAQGARNPKLVEAVAALTAHIFTWIGVTRDRAILSPAERREIVEIEHRDIIEAIAVRAPDRARAAMRRHLLNGRARMLGVVSAIGASRPATRRRTRVS
ncbi:MAG: FadR family transcriptional regulator [Alphaproteobacteria bacterium]|nr:FadR family transcriptional regulator [Alphaproteobacteria bacterium]